MALGTVVSHTESIIHSLQVQRYDEKSMVGCWLNLHGSHRVDVLSEVWNERFVVTSVLVPTFTEPALICLDGFGLQGRVHAQDRSREHDQRQEKVGQLCEFQHLEMSWIELAGAVCLESVFWGSFYAMS